MSLASIPSSDQRHRQSAPASELPPFDWRAHLPVHPACDAYPELPHNELITIGNDIRKRGLRFEIVVRRKENPCKERYHDEFELLDGRSRLDAMAAVGLKFEFKRGNRRSGPFLRFLNSELCGFNEPIKVKVVEIPEEEVKDYVDSANLHRRHLTTEQKRDLIAKLLKAKPEQSDRQIAKQVKVDNKTVGKVRAEQEAREEIPHVEKRKDTKGRKQPAKRKSKAGGKSNIVERDRKTCIALYQKVKDAEREQAQWLIDHPVVKSDSTAEAAIHAKPEAKADATGLGSTIARDWDEVERAFETLTAHTIAQVAQVIPTGKATLITEIKDYFTALAAKLAPRPGNGGAPVAGSDHSIPNDLSIPGFLNRTPTRLTS